MNVLKRCGGFWPGAWKHKLDGAFYRPWMDCSIRAGLEIAGIAPQLGSRLIFPRAQGDTSCAWIN